MSAAALRLPGQPQLGEQPSAQSLGQNPGHCPGVDVPELVGGTLHRNAARDQGPENGMDSGLGREQALRRARLRCRRTPRR